jgi:hypothetical protein
MGVFRIGQFAGVVPWIGAYSRVSSMSFIVPFLVNSHNGTRNSAVPSGSVVVGLSVVYRMANVGSGVYAIDACVEPFDMDDVDDVAGAVNSHTTKKRKIQMIVQMITIAMNTLPHAQAANDLVACGAIVGSGVVDIAI